MEKRCPAGIFPSDRPIQVPTAVCEFALRVGADSGFETRDKEGKHARRELRRRSSGEHFATRAVEGARTPRANKEAQDARSCALAVSPFWIPRSTRRILRRRTLSHSPSLPCRRVRSFGKANKMADAEWDTSKENFQPLRKGRDAKMLSEASGMHHGERATKMKEERRCVSRRASRISNRR